MDYKIKISAKVFLGFLVVLVTSFFSFLLIESRLHPLIATAQEPVEEKDAFFPFSEEKLKTLGVDLASIQTSNKLPYDLDISKSADKGQVNSGESITFSVVITNHGPNPVSYALFRDDYPSQMSNVSYQFSVPNVVSNGEAKPTWMFLDPINSGGTVIATVSGILTSQPDVTVTNEATIDAFDSTQETNIDNNISTVNVMIKGTQPNLSQTVYLPFVAKAPPPTKILAYSEDFNSGNPWLEFDDGNCKTDNTTGQYWVDLNASNKECLPPAKDEDKPESPYRTYGEFEVAAYHSEGESNAGFGLFINGAGAANYYVFRIFPNNSCTTGGDWQLRRRKSNNEITVIQGFCNSAIKRGFGSAATNILRISHTTDRKLSLYANDTLLGSFVESAADELEGEGTGVFVRSADKDVRIKFDNFKVYRFP